MSKKISQFPQITIRNNNDWLLIEEAATGTYKRIKVSDFIAGLSSATAGTESTKILTYASNGDENGLFYFLGTSYGTVAWTNPVTSGKAIITVKTLSSGSIANLVNRQGGQVFYTTNAANSYVAVDVGTKNTLILNNLLLRHDNETGYHLRTFKIQGSNNVTANSIAGLDAATWVDLATFTNDTRINGIDSWGLFPVSTTQAYRWFRVIMTGSDSNGTNYLLLGEIELYGTFTYTI